MSEEKKVPVICDEQGFCKPGPVIPVDPQPLPVCTITIAYAQGSPDQPTIAMSAKGCESPEVALAVLLAALLKANLP